MATILYTFDGDDYANTEAGHQRLLEDIATALETEVYSDPDMANATDDERTEAANMAWDGTNYQADFWDNVMAIMQMAPYAIDVKRIDSDGATADELERAEYAF
jgi:hypothetical protein